MEMGEKYSQNLLAFASHYVVQGIKTKLQFGTEPNLMEKTCGQAVHLDGGKWGSF